MQLHCLFNTISDPEKLWELMLSSTPGGKIHDVWKSSCEPDDLSGLRDQITWGDSVFGPFNERNLEKARKHFRSRRFEWVSFSSSQQVGHCPPASLVLTTGSSERVTCRIRAHARSVILPVDGHALVETYALVAAKLAAEQDIEMLWVDCVSWTNGQTGLHFNHMGGPLRPTYTWIVLLTPAMISALGGPDNVKRAIPVPYQSIQGPTGTSILGRVPLPLDVDQLREWRHFLDPVREPGLFQKSSQDRYSKTPWILPEDLEPGGAWTAD
jgi:hypothetical protein